MLFKKEVLSECSYNLDYWITEFWNRKNYYTNYKDTRSCRIILMENAQFILNSIYQTEEMVIKGLSSEKSELFSNLLRKVSVNTIKR